MLLLLKSEPWCSLGRMDDITMVETKMPVTRRQHLFLKLAGIANVQRLRDGIRAMYWQAALVMYDC